MRLDDIMGQERAGRQLIRAYQSGRVSHAYLFEAPEGCGADLTALAWAQLLLCRHPNRDGTPCGTCPACLEMAAGTHPDCLQIRPEGRTIKIGQIRALRRQLATTSVDGGYTVVVIHQAEAMGPEAANAFLKTLEEPQGPACFVLISARASRLPDTILSRVQAVRFARLSSEQLARIFPQAAQTEAGRLALDLAGGSRDRAQALLDDAEALQKQEDRQQALLTFLDGLPAAHPGAILRFCEGYAHDPEAVRSALATMRRRLAGSCRLRPDPAAVQAFRLTGQTLTALETNTEPSALLAALMIRLAQVLRRQP
jgi:DNA polymerase-3 subunit delta'